MKICTVECNHALGLDRKFGVLLDSGSFLNLQQVWYLDFLRQGSYNPRQKAENLMPGSLHQFLIQQPEPLKLLLETIALWEKLQKSGTVEGAEVDMSALNLRAPLDKIETYRDFYAHEKHVATGFKKRNEPVPEAWYEIPAYYKGATIGFIGPEEEILWPSYSNKLDFELELGVVMAKGGKNIKAKNAMDQVLGFTILNDISARDIQKKEMSIRLGPAKGKDFCSVMGPVITTIDEFDYKEPNLNMKARINGEQWSEGQSADAHYTFAQMIEHASKDEWLAPTDFIGSGTVGTGCGLELDKWIKPGDSIELEVEKIGILKNKVGKNG